MAEAVFRHKVNQAGLHHKIEVDSAGTGHWHVGEPPHQGTRLILDEHNIDHKGIQARQVKPADLKDYDYIIAMDEQNARHLKEMAPEGTEHKIKLLLEFLPESQSLNIPDPYFTGNFEQVYHLIDKSCDRLLQAILKEREGERG
jgi:protein-tyrosine phosphatase